MARKNKKPTANKKPSGVTIIRNVPVDDNGVPVQIKTHKDSKGGHPHIIVDSIDDCHVSVGVTHDNKKGKNATNYAMDKNILGGKKRSYMIGNGTSIKRKCITVMLSALYHIAIITKQRVNDRKKLNKKYNR